MKNPTVKLLCGISALVFANPAFAQTDEQPSESAAKGAEADTSAVPAEEAEAGASNVSTNDIIVTGSRIARNGNNSPSPVTVVSTQDLVQTSPGQMLTQVLNSLPSFSGSRSSSSNVSTTGVASGGNAAANTVNLRNLGLTRNLVLLDGKRVPPTLFNGIVDVDIIPQMMVQRVDIVTGGVSAVYGSDAVSGVVNFILDHDLEGFKVNASSGISVRGDNPRSNIGVAYGQQFGDNIHFEGSYEYNYEGGISRRSDRNWTRQAGVTGAGTEANPFVLVKDIRQAAFPFGGLITSGAFSGQEFATDGVLTPFVPGVATGNSALQIGGNGGFWDGNLVGMTSAHQIFGRLDFDFSTNVRGYAQLSVNMKTNRTLADSTQLSGVRISRTNAFLTPSIQAQIPLNESTFGFNQFLDQFPRNQAEISTNQWVAMAGLDGDLGDFKWNIDFTYGNSTLKTDMSNVLNRQKLAYALDAVSSGPNIVCSVTLTNPGLADDCVPLNVFGPSAASATALGYLNDSIAFRAETRLADVSAGIVGSPFSTWAGPVNVAVSGEYRKTSFESVSSATPGTLANCTGARFNCTSSTALYDFAFGELPFPVTQSVWEVAGEFDLPLLNDVPLVRSFNLNGAGRYTKYDLSGSYFTWKLGIDWRLTDTLRARVTRSRDIRAPNLYDLFAPLARNTVRTTDRLTGLSPTVPSLNQGNPNLTAEIGNSLTAGIVWAPTSSLSFAVDYYNIKISDAITQINGSAPAFQDACYASGGTSSFCDLQVRPLGFSNTTAANQVTAWLITNKNVAQIKTEGVDVEANYRSSVFGRPFSIRFLGTWQPHLTTVQTGAPTIDQAGVAFGPVGLGATPEYRLAGYLKFQPADNVTVDIAQRWRSSMKLSGAPTQVWVNNHMKSFATTAVTVTWDVEAGGADASFFLNVQNLFDTAPPVGGFEGNGTRAGLRDGFASGDDVVGRYFTAGVRMKF